MSADSFRESAQCFANALIPKGERVFSFAAARRVSSCVKMRYSGDIFVVLLSTLFLEVYNSSSLIFLPLMRIFLLNMQNLGIVDELLVDRSWDFFCFVSLPLLILMLMVLIALGFAS